MKRNGFTLLELMTAVLLGGMVILMIAGGLRGAIRSWEAVQVRVGENYNRRSVLELLKRQCSSLHFKEDQAQLEGTIGGGKGGANNRRNRGNLGVPTTDTLLPDGVNFFKGMGQELSFVSTVSFLSDFPGQVGVRYYVVKGNPDEGQSLADMPHSRSLDQFDVDDDDDGVRSDLDFDYDVEGQVELEGQLYLYLEEKNLFLATTLEEEAQDNTDPFAEVDAEDEAAREDGNGEENLSTVYDTSRMKLIGPLRRFFVRYMKDGVSYRSGEDVDDDELWDKGWDVERQGGYPRAIQLNLVFEPDGDPDTVADIADEDLENVSLVFPVYHKRTMTRSHQGFGDEE